MVKAVNKIGLFCLVFIGFVSIGISQELTIEYKKTIQLKGANLGDILSWLSRDYDISFSYSRDRLPIDKRVVWSEFSGEMEYDLKEFFEKNNIQFRKIGNQYVLRYEAEDTPLPEPGVSRNQLEEELGKLIGEENTYPKREPVMELSSLSSVMPEVFFENRRLPEIGLTLPDNAEPIKSNLKAQVSFLPKLRSYGEDPRNRKNNISFNILWGRHQSLDGVEFGGLVNEIYGKMDGFQIAGVANMVGGDAVGLQFASWMNLNEQHTRGVQISGAVNSTQSLDGFQVALATNISKQSSRGAQFSSILNIGRGADRLIQMAGGFNISTGQSMIQMAGLFNSAEDVDGFQAAPFFNKAKKVRGSQIGLINVSDTISGLSIGLINYVKKGYNRLEIGNTSAYQAYVNIKLGSHRFYNNFRAGYFTKEKTSGWALGYGIGTTVPLTKRSYANADFTADLINLGKWSREARVLYSISAQWSYRMSKRMTAFVGPAVHWIVMNKASSAKLDPIIGPNFGLKNEHITSDFSWWNWIGWSIGLRFG